MSALPRPAQPEAGPHHVGDVGPRPVGSPPVGLGTFAAYVSIVVVSSVAFSRAYVVGLQTDAVEIFSLAFIPALTVSLRLLLLRLAPLRVYAAVVVVDLLLKVVLASYSSWFHENLEIHSIIQNVSEGVWASSAILQSVQTGVLVVGGGLVGVEIALARRLPRRLIDRGLLVFGLPAALLYGAVLAKIPPSSAAKVTDYTLCIKVHGYYAALLSDLVFTGVRPSREELHGAFHAMQAKRPAPAVRVTATGRRHEDLLVIQAESLDWAVLGHRVDGRGVAPFLDRLATEAVTLKLDPNHTAQSGSSGADFQVLTGRHPHPYFPSYKLRSLDMSMALPAMLARHGVKSLAFHGNAASMWARGQAFERMGFDAFYDESAYPHADSRWGVNDRIFFDGTKRLIEVDEPGRSFYFLVTLSTHYPFDYVEHDGFAGSSRARRYFNAIHFLDRALERFLGNLKGDYLVLLYGDHGASISTADYRSSDGEREPVPAFVFGLVNGRIEPPEIEIEPKDGLDLRALYRIALEAYP